MHLHSDIEPDKIIGSDILIILSFPFVKLLRSSDLLPYISTEIRACDRISLVEQSFWGKFKGSAFLVFPADSGKKFCPFSTVERVPSMN